MKTETKGWVVLTERHPNGNVAIVDNSSFAYSKKESIEKFTEGSGEKWEYWRKKYGYKAVKARMIIETITQTPDK